MRSAKYIVHREHDFSSAVDKIASGFFRIISYIGDHEKNKPKWRLHRSVILALGINSDISKEYRHLVKSILTDQNSLTIDSWTNYRDTFMKIARALCVGDIDENKATEYLTWCEEENPSIGGLPIVGNAPSPNVYYFGEGERNLGIRLGTIHSVKGQTHLATLLLSTFMRKHHFSSLMPWLLGNKSHLSEAGKEDRRRLLQTYVAMTRPSHMVCLAIPKSSFSQDGDLCEAVSVLENKGWTIRTLFS